MKNLLLTLAFGLASLISFSQTFFVVDELQAYTENSDTSIYVVNDNSLTFTAPSGNQFTIVNCESDWTIIGALHNSELDYTSSQHSDTTLYYKINPDGGSVIIDLTIIFNETGTDPSASTSENKLTSEVFKVYPSPATSEVKISFLADSRDIPVNIFSLNGQLVYSNSDFREVGLTVLDVNLTEFHSGIYFVKIGNHTEKLIIE